MKTNNPASYTGLTSSEVALRLVTHGKNVFIEREHQSAFSTFLEAFKSPLVLMLIGASIISAFTGSYTSAILIIAIIFISSLLDFYISYKSQKAVEKLAAKIAPRTKVLRDGHEQTVLIETIVPGDIIVLEAGDVVPADGKVVQGVDLYTNESSLTGESMPIEKNIDAFVFLGSGVVTGRALVEVVDTGKKTKFYSIAALLNKKDGPTSFEKGISSFSSLVTKVVLVMVVFVFIVNAALKGNPVEALIFALALAVGLTPELLPMMIAFNVSRASIKMSHKGVIVKKLSAIENFGGMDILCTDKTGTLTEDKITLVKCIDQNGVESRDVFLHSYLSSYFHTGTRSPLDEAIFEKEKVPVEGYVKQDEIPFDFERRRDSIIIEYENKTAAGSSTTHLLISKGAPENILSVSRITPDERTKAMALFDDLLQSGYRVIAVATKKVHKGLKEIYTAEDEKNLDFSGFIAFIDPPKVHIKDTLDLLKQRGITIKIITGDHGVIAEKIAKEVGLVSLGTLTSEAIDLMSDEELALKAELTTIFARVTPAQKSRIISALQSKKHVVGYMGDGINDAPALRDADVGISVDNAVDVAKESADIILLDKSFTQLIDGVLEGRKTFANTTKYINMALSSNFGNMFSMTGASIFLPFLPMLPVQLLLNNLLYEGSQFFLSFDHVEEEVLNKPKPWDIQAIKKFMIVFGSISSIFDFITFYVLYQLLGLGKMIAGESSAAFFQTGWFIESFATQTLVIFLIRIHSNIWSSSARKNKPHIAVIASTLLAVAAAWCIALGPIGYIFGFVTLPTSLVLTIAGIVVVYLITVESAKVWFYRKYFTKN